MGECLVKPIPTTTKSLSFFITHVLFSDLIEIHLLLQLLCELILQAVGSNRGHTVERLPKPAVDGRPGAGLEPLELTRRGDVDVLHEPVEQAQRHKHRDEDG